MQLFFRLDNGHEFEFEIEAAETVIDLKAKVAAHLGVFPDAVALFHHRRELGDENLTLEEAGVRRSATLSVRPAKINPEIRQRHHRQTTAATASSSRRDGGDQDNLMAMEASNTGPLPPAPLDFVGDSELGSVYATSLSAILVDARGRGGGGGGGGGGTGGSGGSNSGRRAEGRRPTDWRLGGEGGGQGANAVASGQGVNRGWIDRDPHAAPTGPRGAWVARQPSGDREVAVVVLNGDHTAADVLARLRDPSLAGGRLRLGLHDDGNDGGGGAETRRWTARGLGTDRRQRRQSSKPVVVAKEVHHHHHHHHHYHGRDGGDGADRVRRQRAAAATVATAATATDPGGAANFPSRVVRSSRKRSQGSDTATQAPKRQRDGEYSPLWEAFGGWPPL